MDSVRTSTFNNIILRTTLSRASGTSSQATLPANLNLDTSATVSAKDTLANLTDIHEQGVLSPQPLLSTQQAIIDSINRRKRAERSHEMMARGSLASNHDGSPARNPADSWLGARMSPQRHPGAVSVPGQLHLPTTIRHPLSHVHSKGKTTAMPLSIPITTSKLSSGLKIRIPRDLPNLPEAFRKRGAIRSQSTSTSPARPSNKRTHSAMMMEDSSGGNSYISYAVPGEGPRIKIMRKQPSAVGPIPPHLANATNLAIRTAKTPVSASAASSPSTNNSSASQTPATAPAGVATADGLGRVDETVVKHRSQSKAGSSSPNSTPVQFPSPVPSVDSVATMPSSASSPTVDSSKNTNHTHEARPVDGVTRGVSAGSGALFNTPTPAVSVTMNAQAIPEQLSPSSGATEVLDMDHDSLQPIEL
ncbi:hypothetical protein BGZ54_003237, partial [Gamsiella multidivaricata]